jgi:hypothetical protein
MSCSILSCRANKIVTALKAEFPDLVVEVNKDKVSVS